MMQVNALAEHLRQATRDFSVRVAAGVQGERCLILLGKLKRGVEVKNGQFTRQGRTKICCQGLDYLLALAPE
jgi:hypothetical protein